MDRVITILINYNGFADTVECIKSIKESSYKSDIFVVDNSEKDSDFVKLSKIKDIKVIRCENNGFSAANNIGFRYAIENNYNYVIILNNDTVIDKYMIQRLIVNCDSNSVSLPYMYYFDYKDELWYAGGIINRYLGTVTHHNTTEKKSDYVTGCCICIPKVILKRVGFLNEKFFMYCEDFDYSIRLQKKGIAINVVSDAVLWHKVGKSSRGSDSSVYYNVRNRLILIKDNLDFFSFTALPYAFITRVIKIIYCIIKHDLVWRVHYEALCDFVKNINGKRK